MPGENVGLRFFAKTGQLRPLALMAGLFQLLHRFDAQPSCSALTFLGPRPGMLEHQQQARRHGILQFVVIGQFAGGEQFGKSSRADSRRCP